MNEVNDFMKILYDELEKEHYGDIDPIWLISDDIEHKELKQVFIKAIDKLN